MIPYGPTGNRYAIPRPQGAMRSPVEATANTPEVTAEKSGHMKNPSGKPRKKRKKTELPDTQSKLLKWMIIYHP